MLLSDNSGYVRQMGPQHHLFKKHLFCAIVLLEDKIHNQTL